MPLGQGEKLDLPLLGVDDSGNVFLRPGDLAIGCTVKLGEVGAVWIKFVDGVFCHKFLEI